MMRLPIELNYIVVRETVNKLGDVEHAAVATATDERTAQLIAHTLILELRKSTQANVWFNVHRFDELAGG